MTTSLINYLSSLEDPRIDRNNAHMLIDIIVLMVCAMVSGADGWEAIEDFDKEKLDIADSKPLSILYGSFPVLGRDSSWPSFA